MDISNSFKVRRRDGTIKQLQEDLMESQAQYTACYNEVCLLYRSIVRSLSLILNTFPILFRICVLIVICRLHVAGLWFLLGTLVPSVLWFP